MTKLKLVDNDGFQTFVEVIDCVKPENYKQIRFTTVFARSRHPEGDREAYSVTLSPTAYSNLIDLLTKDDTVEELNQFNMVP
jgi:hypothetical protein